jgi:hypothetical protein
MKNKVKEMWKKEKYRNRYRYRGTTKNNEKHIMKKEDERRMEIEGRLKRYNGTKREGERKNDNGERHGQAREKKIKR